LKIAFLIRQLGSSGGVERRLEQLRTSDLNSHFEIVTFSFLGILETYPTISRLSLPFKYFQRLIKLHHFLIKEKPDIIHAFDLESMIYVSIAKRFIFSRSVKIIGSYGSSIIYSPLIKSVLSSSFFHPSIFICNSDVGKKSFLNATKNKVKVKVIYNGFTVKDVQFPTVPPKWYEPNNKYVGLISKFDDNKKAMRIFDIVDLIPENLNIYFIVVGTGRDFHLAELKRNQDEKYKKYILLLGVVQDAWKLIPWFDMGLLVSDREGFPTVLIEFLSMKKNVLSTACGESSFILNSGKAGIIEKEFNAQVFSNHILRECGKSKLNLEGYNWYKENFLFDVMLENYKSIYLSM
jgi:glycosyltransferase involved in cell wall biosynthesis